MAGGASALGGPVTLSSRTEIKLHRPSNGGLTQNGLVRD
jgi:hypothetical protein